MFGNFYTKEKRMDGKENRLLHSFNRYAIIRVIIDKMNWNKGKKGKVYEILSNIFDRVIIKISMKMKII